MGDVAGDVDLVPLVLLGRLDPCSAMHVVEDGLVDLAAGEPVGVEVGQMKAPFSSRLTRRPKM